MRSKHVVLATVITISLLLLLLLNTKITGVNHKRYASITNNYITREDLDKHQPSSVELSCYRLNNTWVIKEPDKVKLACRKHFPRAIIIGAQGCGSGVLRNLLAVHPGVACPMQDTDFFSANYYKDMAWYFNQMPHATERQLTLEKSSGYLTYPGTAARISKDLSDVKIIVLLCDPVKRALSDYQTNKVSEYALVNWAESTKLSLKQAQVKIEVQKAWEEYAKNNPSQYLRKNTFGKTVLDTNGEIVIDSLYIDKGIYAKHMKQWLQYFSRQHILILDIDGNDIMRDPLPILRKVEGFLELSPYFQQENFLINKATGLKCIAKPLRACMDSNKRGRLREQLGNKIRDNLEAFYMPHNVELQQLLNKTIKYN